MDSNFFDLMSMTSDYSNSYLLTVTQLSQYVESLLSCDRLLSNVSIEGEISGFKRHYNTGHCYFTLKDEESSLHCVMFKGSAIGLEFSPNDGMHVVISGYVGLYKRDGQFQFYVQKMHPVGEGELYAKYLILREKLREEGLFDESHKKALPTLPFRIGVVTSRSGAVLHDIKNVIRRRFPNMNILLSECSVQGAVAACEIIKALKLLDNSGLVDVIILGRGGGSIEDLWCFNDEKLARAIYECKTPIISAVGHETDFTIADFVADMRAPTPSAAAELAVPEYEKMAEEIDGLIVKLKSIVLEEIETQQERIEMMEKLIPNFDQIISVCELTLSQMNERIKELMCYKIDAADLELFSMLEMLDVLSPTATLLRGYSLLRDKNEKSISSAKQLKEAEYAKVIFSDGEVDIKVI